MRNRHYILVKIKCDFMSGDIHIHTEDVMAYNIVHNQRTGSITVRTETGYYKYSQEQVRSIEWKELSDVSR